MITTFDTSGAGSAPSGSKGGSNKLILIVVAAGALYLGYKFVVKPYLDKRNNNEQ